MWGWQLLSNAFSITSNFSKPTTTTTFCQTFGCNNSLFTSDFLYTNAQFLFMHFFRWHFHLQARQLLIYLEIGNWQTSEEKSFWRSGTVFEIVSHLYAFKWLFAGKGPCRKFHGHRGFVHLKKISRILIVLITAQELI